MSKLRSITITLTDKEDETTGIDVSLSPPPTPSEHKNPTGALEILYGLLEYLEDFGESKGTMTAFDGDNNKVYEKEVNIP